MATRRRTNQRCCETWACRSQTSPSLNGSLRCLTRRRCWDPGSPAELEWVRESGWTAWPPHLLDQPISLPVLNEDYATKIARDWNAPRDGVGYVTRFEADGAFAERYPVQQAGGSTILELWVPAEELDNFNHHIIGAIEVIAEYRKSEA